MPSLVCLKSDNRVLVLNAHESPQMSPAASVQQRTFSMTWEDGAASSICLQHRATEQWLSASNPPQVVAAQEPFRWNVCTLEENSGTVKLSCGTSSVRWLCTSPLDRDTDLLGVTPNESAAAMFQIVAQTEAPPWLQQPQDDASSAMVRTLQNELAAIRARLVHTPTFWTSDWHTRVGPGYLFRESVPSSFPPIPKAVMLVARLSVQGAHVMISPQWSVGTEEGGPGRWQGVPSVTFYPRQRDTAAQVLVRIYHNLVTVGYYIDPANPNFMNAQMNPAAIQAPFDLQCVVLF